MEYIIASMNTKIKWLRVRLSEEEDEIIDKWAKAYGEDRSAFVRRMLRSLPDEPPVIPQPPVKI